MSMNKIKRTLLSACILSVSASAMAGDYERQHYVPHNVVENTVKNVVFGVNQGGVEQAHTAHTASTPTKNDKVAQKQVQPVQSTAGQVVVHDDKTIKEHKEVVQEKPEYKGKEKLVVKKAEPKAKIDKDTTPEVASVVAPASTVFTANRNDRLSKVLKSWAEQEGWSLYWSSEDDFYLPTNLTMTGSLEEVFTHVGKALKGEGIDFQIKMYRLNKTIVVK